jgi:FKBP-type peptidyl-prolyl cis-trans isomerase FklB
MKFKSIIVCGAIALMGVLMSEASAQGEAKPSTETVGYAIGQQFGAFLELGKGEFDMEALLKGINDKLDGKDSKFDDATLQQAFMSFQQVIGEKQQAMAAEDAAAASGEGIAYLAANAKKKGVVVLPSGLQYEVITEGTGVIPKASDTVKAHYSGTFITGEKFDSSYDRGEPTSFPVTRVIPGWTEALQLMKVGSKWKLTIPFELAYGAEGRPGIPGGSCLLFDIELVGIE